MGHSRKDPHLGSPQKKWKMTLLGQPNLPPPPPWTAKPKIITPLGHRKFPPWGG